jgi:hypothetical protein
VPPSLKQGVGIIPACTVILLMSVCLGSHWSLRPQVFSYVLFAGLLALLSHCFAGWEGKWQWPQNLLAVIRGKRNRNSSRSNTPERLRHCGSFPPDGRGRIRTAAFCRPVHYIAHLSPERGQRTRTLQQG